MLICVGTTALYSLRMVWMVFYGKQSQIQPAHDGRPAMRVSLILLAIGTLTTWLLGGGLGRLMAASLPFHAIEAERTLQMVEKIVAAAPTWITLAVVAL